jgi:hypothetical protein
MTTTRLRWPSAAEAERQEAQQSAEEAARLLDESNKLLRCALDQVGVQNGAGTKIATALALQSQALALQERIQRLMIQAHAQRRSKD